MLTGNSFPAIYDCKTTNGAVPPVHKVAVVNCTPDKRGFYWVVAKDDHNDVLTVLNAREMTDLRKTTQVVQSLYGVVTTTVSI